MKIEQLYYFYEISKTGSISEAAEKIFVTPQALSKALLNLEKEVGVELFIRNPKGMQLTKNGEIFFEKVNKLLYDYAHLTEDLQIDAQENLPISSGHVTLCSTSFLNNLVLEKILLEMKLEYPNITISFFECYSEQIIPFVISNGGLGLLTCITEHFKEIYKKYNNLITYETLDQDELGILVSNNSYLAKQKNISLFDAVTCPFATFYYQDFSGMQSLYSKLLPKPKTVVNSTNKKIVLQAVQDDLAVAFGLCSNISYNDFDIKFIPLKEHLHISTLLIKSFDSHDIAENKVIQKIREHFHY